MLIFVLVFMISEWEFFWDDTFTSMIASGVATDVVIMLFVCIYYMVC